MKRAIVTPAILPVSALAELKQWLGISTTHDDALLSALLRAALDMCEAFTGLMPLEALCEEVTPVRGGWLPLTVRPVQAITAMEAVTQTGERTAMDPGDYEIELDADGTGKVRLLRRGNATNIAVRFIAGLAPGWDSLPEAMRHGIVRLAAHQHREREASGAAPQPPAAVAALWQPWRRMRLA
ncbi:MAG: phage head-tail connector protein [Novosphingobium sp.]|nr:phage head-tail connector protein [Novosphingobium sp.]